MEERCVVGIEQTVVRTFLGILSIAEELSGINDETIAYNKLTIVGSVEDERTTSLASLNSCGVVLLEGVVELLLSYDGTLLIDLVSKCINRFLRYRNHVPRSISVLCPVSNFFIGRRNTE